MDKRQLRPHHPFAEHYRLNIVHPLTLLHVFSPATYFWRLGRLARAARGYVNVRRVVASQLDT